MQAPTQAQIYTGLRYAGVIVGAVGTFAATLSLLPPETAQAIVAQFQIVADDLKKTIGDIYALAYLIIPVATLWLAKIGWKSASPQSQAAAVQSRSDMQVETSNPDIAKAVPGVKLVRPDQIPQNS